MNNVLHFLQNGTCKLMFSHRKTMYYAPLVLILKCLVDWPDHYIYRFLLHGMKNDLYYVNCIQNMLRELHEQELNTQAECRAYLGRMFRPKVVELPPWATDLEATEFLLKRCVMIHLDDYKDKFYGLVFMTQKLFDLVQNKCKVEGADAVMVQELQVGGHLYLQVLKERLQNLMYVIKLVLEKKARTGTTLTFNAAELQSIIRSAGSLEQKMETFISTGNAPSTNLLPDAWGFVCPVTPFLDRKQTEKLPHVLENCVFIDGRLVGYLPEDTAHKSMAYVRTLKVMSEDVPITTEIVLRV
ncbi:unnamed protein product [Leptidea sinapis]|uniref:DNA-directed RNA polymerase n=1 Tax=Leptidea sinapis TaxID=189913 RepID=A0A5E4QFH6_9NEOP|nr:unnamed protein product [Leptidea sinapis]